MSKLLYNKTSNRGKRVGRFQMFQQSNVIPSHAGYNVGRNLEYADNTPFNPNMLEASYARDKYDYNNEEVTHDNRNWIEKKADKNVAWGNSPSPIIDGIKSINPLVGGTMDILNSAGTHGTKLFGDFSRVVTGNGITTAPREAIDKAVNNTTDKNRVDAATNIATEVALAYTGETLFNKLPIVKNAVKKLPGKMKAAYMSDKALPLTKQLAKIKGVPVPEKAIQGANNLYRGVATRNQQNVPRYLAKGNKKGYGYNSEWAGETSVFSTPEFSVGKKYSVPNAEIMAERADNIVKRTGNDYAKSSNPFQNMFNSESKSTVIAKKLANKENRYIGVYDRAQLGKTHTMSDVNPMLHKLELDYLARNGGAGKIHSSNISRGDKVMMNHLNNDITAPGRYLKNETYRPGGNSTEAVPFKNLPFESKNVTYRDPLVKSGIKHIEEFTQPEIQHLVDIKPKSVYKFNKGSDMVKRVFELGGVLYRK